MATFATPRDLLLAEPRELATTDWVTVDQARINGFAESSGDHQWIHVDPERAKHGPFGTTIAHGFLTLSLVPIFLAEALVIEQVNAALNYGLNKVRFTAPVPVDSRVRGHVNLVSAVERGAMVETTFAITVELEGAERPACVAEMVVLYS